MTKLTPGKSVTRETAEFERTRELCIRLHPRYLEIWARGLREKYTLDYAALLDYCRKRAVRDRIAVPKPRKGKS